MLPVSRSCNFRFAVFLFRSVQLFNLRQTIINLCIALGFLAHGYATGEFEVTEERLACYLPVRAHHSRHINPSAERLADGTHRQPQGLWRG